MKLKLIAMMFLAGGALFAQSRFSIIIGGNGPGYYAPPPVYYAPVRPHVFYREYSQDGRGWGGAGYWGEDPDRQHRRAEWYGLHSHQQGERFMYGDSEELDQHHAEERRQLRHEQWHEWNGDFEAADGPAHGSARDGYRFRH